MTLPNVNSYCWTCSSLLYLADQSIDNLLLLSHVTDVIVIRYISNHGNLILQTNIGFGS